MAKKQWIIGGLLVLFGIIFIVLSALTPMIVEEDIKTKAIHEAVLNSTNKKSYWGEIPGKLKEVVFMTFNFYNIENPDQVMWNGATPSLTEKNGYIYQEFGKFVDTSHSSSDLKFFQYSYLKKTGNCIWSNTTHPTDKITTINMGAFSEWFWLKNMPRQRMALYTFYDLFYHLTANMSLAIYSKAVKNDFNDFNSAFNKVLQPAGFDLNDSLLIYEDPYFGLGQESTLQYWVLALIENVNGGNFVMPSNLTGPLQQIALHFTFTDSEVEALFSGGLLASYLKALSGVYSLYRCSGMINNMKMCDPIYLGGLQWSKSGVTLDPYLGLWPRTASISVFFPYLTGNVEMQDYLQSTTTGQKYPNVSFSSNNFEELFFFDWETGWPVYYNTSFMDVGRMNNLFQSAYNNDFTAITNQFGLQDNNMSRVLWDYVNSIVDYTALQGNYDPAVYDYLDRGISSELGFGMIGGEALQNFFNIYSNNLNFMLTALYGFAVSEYEHNYTCAEIVNDTLSEMIFLCDLPDLLWDNSTTGYRKWLGVYWYGLQSPAAEEFLNISGISYNILASLFDPSKPLVGNFSDFDKQLKEYYNCSNYGARCSNEYMAMTQIFDSGVSRFLPPVFEVFSELPLNSSTFYDLEYLNIGLTMPSEYYAYSSSTENASITVEQGNLLFSTSGLFTAQNFQRFFMNIYSQNYSAISDEYKISDPLTLANYIRVIVNHYYFNGLITTKTVEQILFDYSDPLIEARKNMSPLKGGDPTLDSSLILLGKNQSREQWEYYSSYFRHKVHTGKDHHKKTRDFLLVNGKDYLNYVKSEYLGEGPYGPNIAIYNKNPWKNLTKFKGSNGWGFQPNIDHSSDLHFTQVENCLTYPLKYDKVKIRGGLKCYRFELGNSPFLNVTQNAKMDNFYNNAPTGLINLTTIKNMPVFLSRPYFLMADKKLRNLVSYTTPEYNMPDNYKTYFDIEKYSGIPLAQKQQFQYNFLLKPDIMMPLVGKTGLKSVGYFMYLPVYFTQRAYTLTDSHIDKNFDYIKEEQMISTIVLYTGLPIGCILVVSALLYALKIKITNNRAKRSMVVSQSRQPILLA